MCTSIYSEVNSKSQLNFVSSAGVSFQIYPKFSRSVFSMIVFIGIGFLSERNFLSNVVINIHICISN